MQLVKSEAASSGWFSPLMRQRWLCGLVLLSAACSGTDTGPAAWTITDSAGVEWYAFRGEADSLKGTWREVRAVHADSFHLGNILDAAIGEDGALAILDGLGGQVFMIRPNGDTNVIGRNGDGPGEFRFPVSVTRSSNRVQAFDRRRGRLIAFDLSGELIEETPISQSPTLWMVPLGVRQAIALRLELGRSNDATADRATLVESDVILGVVDEVGREETILRRPGPPEILVGSTSMPLPVMAHPRLRTRADGGAVFISGVAAEVALVSTSGELEAIFHWSNGLRPVTDALWDSLRYSVESTARPGSASLVDAMFDERFRPSFMPWAREVAASSAEIVWVQEAEGMNGVSRRIFRIDLGERSVTSGLLPQPARLLAVQGDTIIVRTADDLGVHTLRWWTLQ